jgi:hypothetical protein
VSENSQFQFALLQLLQKELCIAPERVKLFDPVFVEADVTLIESYGFDCLLENTVR